MNAMIDQTQLLSVSEAAQFLKISQSLVYSLIERGKLAHYRLGLGRGGIRISQADLFQYLDSKRVGKWRDAPKQRVAKAGATRHLRPKRHSK